MKKVGDSIELSANDLVGFLHCHHLTALDRAVAEGTLAKPPVWDDPLLEALSERGKLCEQGFIERLEAAGIEVARIVPRSGGTVIFSQNVRSKLRSTCPRLPRTKDPTATRIKGGDLPARSREQALRIRTRESGEAVPFEQNAQALRCPKQILCSRVIVLRQDHASATAPDSPA
jgi:hypothetical protein